MKIYLAAPYTRREEMRGYAFELHKAGHSVTSRWVGETHQDNGVDGVKENEIEFNRRCAMEDIEDIRAADVLIFFSEPPRSSYSRGGRHFEMGYALAIGVTVVSIGYRENIFHSLDEVTFVPDFDHVRGALDYLREELKAEVLD